MSRPPAPEPLRLVQRFVNTRDVESEKDALATVGGLRDWLVDQGLLPPTATISEEDRQRTVEVREALRCLLLANNGEPLDPEAVARLNRLACAAPLRVAFGVDGRAVLHPAAAGVDGALARILAVVVSAMEEGTWQRLKVCREDSCLWSFYDRSRNRSGNWCEMAVCGNRAKARAYRRRRHA